MRRVHLNTHGQQHPTPTPWPTHALPIEQHCPTVIALSRHHPNGCHIPGHVHLGSLVGLVHSGTREGQTENLQQWLNRSQNSAGQIGAAPSPPPALLQDF